MKVFTVSKQSVTSIANRAVTVLLYGTSRLRPTLTEPSIMGRVYAGKQTIVGLLIGKSLHPPPHGQELFRAPLGQHVTTFSTIALTRAAHRSTRSVCLAERFSSALEHRAPSF